MINILKNYMQTILLVLAILIGGVIGILSPDFALTLKPLGDLFINLIFIIIVPLIFFSISSSIAKMSETKRFGKIMGAILVVFIITSIIAVVIGLISTYVYKPLDDVDIELIKDKLTVEEETEIEELNGLEQFVNSITVSDFSDLMSRQNILQIIVFAILFGVATSLIGEKGKPVAVLLSSANEVVMKIVSIIMLYAPIGLGCYFAALIGDLGASLVTGYIKAFVGYTVLSIIYYFVVYTIYAYIAGKKDGVKAYWKNIIPPSLTALATCSSGVSIPSNITAARRMGVPDDIAETTVSLGTNIHKEGSLIGSVLKIVFLFCLFGRDMTSIPVILGILGGAILVGFLISAVPVGGGVISEMMILSLFGFPASAVGILAIIATIIDAPATVLNVVGNTASSMLTARFVEGKNWMKKSVN